MSMKINFDNLLFTILLSLSKPRNDAININFLERDLYSDLRNFCMLVALSYFLEYLSGYDFGCLVY